MSLAKPYLRNPKTELYLSAKSLRLWLGEARERWLAFLPKSGNTLGKIAPGFRVTLKRDLRKLQS